MQGIHSDIPTVGMSAIMTRLREFAKLRENIWSTKVAVGLGVRTQDLHFQEQN